MTTTPKAKKFRIRREAPVQAGPRPSLRAQVQAPPQQAPQAAAQPAAQPPISAAVSAPVSPAVLPSETPKSVAEVLQPMRAAKAAPQPAPLALANPDDSLFDSQEDGFGAMGIGAEKSPPAAEPAQKLAPEEASVLAPDERSSEEEIAAIRNEGLTGRQLRMARRVAQKHGIEATSDFEAVRLLRRQGIDPFDKSVILGAVIPALKGAQPAPDQPVLSGKDDNQVISRALAKIDGKGADTRVQLPQTLPAGANLPVDYNNGDYRASEIMRIQRDITQRRRRKVALLFTRLGFFVGLPTLACAYYFFVMATPLFATKTEFVIQKAEGASGAGGLSSMFSGTQLATNQDSVTVQSYLQSRDAMIRLDQDRGYKTHWSQVWIDPLQKLEPSATNEDAYKLFRNNVIIGYDPSEGVIKMEVIAADPQVSVQFSEALLSYAEEQVDQLTQRLRGDQMQGARDSYADAEAKVLAAQQRVLELQEQLGVLDPVTETQSVMAQINTFEIALQEKRLSLQQLLDNPSPNQARVEGTKGDIERLEALIKELRSGLTQGNAGNSSLASVTGQLRIAEADLETRQLMLSQAAQQLELARIEANKQVRYISMGVRPVAPDEPTYPRAFENTVLAFLIFCGIYLMVSLTASILREQVSA